VNTRFRNNPILFNAYNVVKCEAHVRAVQRLKIPLIAHNASASQSCIRYLDQQSYMEKRYVLTVFRNDKVMIFGRYHILYVLLGSLHQSDA